jgi:hypothetical protein
MLVNSLISLFFIGSFVTTSEGKYEIDKGVVKSDLAHIGCDVCLQAMSEIYYAAEVAKSKAPYKKLNEMAIFDIIDKICAPDSAGGLWIRTLDITEHKEGGRRYLSLEKPGGMSTCGRECGTIEKSCLDLFDEDIDRDELAVLLWKNKTKSLEELQVLS